MLTIVTTPAQAMSNIRRFEPEIQNSPELKARLAYARAWYALKDEHGQWLFGPSKFIGYQDVTAKAYLEDEDTDGRRTEMQLQRYFRTIDANDALYPEVSSELAVFLAKHGKAPSNKMRINVLRDRRLIASPDTLPSDSQAAVVDLMVAVSKTLPDELFRRLRSQLDDVWAA